MERVVVLREPGGATAEVRLHCGVVGLHVSSWKNKEGEELLNVSPSRAGLFQGIRTYFKTDFRGSAPPELPHGFRSSRIPIDPNSPGSSRPTVAGSLNLCASSLNLSLCGRSVTLIWTWDVRMPDGRPLQNAGKYTLHQTITLGSSGELTSDFWVTNAGIVPFKFLFALLNDLPDSDSDEVRLEGLQMLRYYKWGSREVFTENGQGSITFDPDVERVYLDTPTTISITNYDKKKTYVLKKRNLPEVVVGRHRVEEHKLVLSVGGGAGKDAIELRPAQVWHAHQQISVVPTCLQVDPNMDSLRYLQEFYSR